MLARGRHEVDLRPEQKYLAAPYILTKFPIKQGVLRSSALSLG